MSALNMAWLRPRMYEKYSLLWFNKDLDIDREELTESLWKKYNEVAFPIQSLDAFHSDALAASREARDVEEFHALMEEKKKQRLNEFGECARALETIFKKSYQPFPLSDPPVRALVCAASLEKLIATVTSSLGTESAETTPNITYRLQDESKANLEYLRDHPQPPRSSSPSRQTIPVPGGDDLKAWIERTPIRRTTAWLRDTRLRTMDDFSASPVSSTLTQSRATDTADLADWIHCLSRTTPEEEQSQRSKEALQQTYKSAGSEKAITSKPKTTLGKRLASNPKKSLTPQKVTKKTVETYPTSTRQTRSMTKGIASSPIPTPIKDTSKRSKPPSKKAATPKAAAKKTITKKR